MKLGSEHPDIIQIMSWLGVTYFRLKAFKVMRGMSGNQHEGAWTGASQYPAKHERTGYDIFWPWTIDSSVEVV